MKIASFIGALAGKGMKFSVLDAELKVQGPKGLLGDEERAFIATHKEAIKDFLLNNRDDGHRHTLPPPRPVPYAENGYPLSSQQLSLWVICQTQPDTHAYNMPLAFDLRGHLDAALLSRCARELYQRHEALRTRFVLVNGEPRQRIGAPDEFVLEVSDATPELARAAYLAESKHSFRLDTGPLFRARLLRLTPEHHVLLLNLHHIICDGATIEMLLAELLALYRDGGSPGLLTPLPLQYKDYSCWQREVLEPSEAFRDCLAYWRAALRDAPPLITLPVDKPRPAVRSLAGHSITFALPEALSADLQQLANQRGVTAYMLLLAAFKVLLHRYTGQRQLVVGTPSANRDRPEQATIAGYFINTLPLYSTLDPAQPFSALLAQVKEVVLGAFEHQSTTLLDIVNALGVERSSSHDPVFQVFFSMQNDLRGTLRAPGLEITMLPPTVDISKLDLTLYFTQRSTGELIGTFEFSTDLFLPASIAAMADNFQHLLGEIVRSHEMPCGRYSLLAADQRERILEQWNGRALSFDEDDAIHRLIERQAVSSPERCALVSEGVSLSFGTLNRRANQLAAHLAQRGAVPGCFVGVAMQRSAEMVVALLAVLKTGAAYVPLDPGYPLDRIHETIADAGLSMVVTEQSVLPILSGEGYTAVSVDAPETRALVELADGSDRCLGTPGLAYMIYTSGSTGRPKGVKISHRNVLNLFAGLNRAMPEAAVPATWLAVTSISFDISVLELFWTLSNGCTVVIQPDMPVPHANAAGLDFGLFYFAAQEAQDDKYRLLLEGARFADRNGLNAVWVPERHFHSFGDHFPNPAVAAAAVAAVTERIGIRSGSVVLPLHDTIRVAEEWSMVDHLSNGRVEMSFASGWHPNDFVLAPDAYHERHRALREQLDDLKLFWGGAPLRRTNGKGEPVDVYLHPRPHNPRLATWITAAGSPDTFRYAGSIGANLLTHALGQNQEELAANIRLYREARAAHGFDPGTGKVALMLHTFIADDAACLEATVKEPFKNYLRNSLNLLKPLAEQAGLDLGSHQEQVLEMAYRRYAGDSGMIGTVQTCLRRAAELIDIGVDEIACLIDFGIDDETTLAHLPNIARLQRLIRQRAAQQRTIAARGQGPDTAGLVLAHGVTRLQTTPSFARHLLAGTDGMRALAQLDTLLVGGEALPPDLAAGLTGALGGTLYNMYGPTETTVWSSARRIEGDRVSLGAPLANTRFYVVNPDLVPVPAGVPGELLIGGAGVAAGYHRRDELNRERFIEASLGGGPAERLYRTGDLVRWTSAGELDYLGRLDFQVKLRGFRFELGEIEARLLGHEGVRECAVVIAGKDESERRLVAWVVPQPSPALPDAELTLEQVNRHLAASLPHYMLPAQLVLAEALPLAPNGKLDRKTLMEDALRQRSRDAIGFRAPASPTECALAALWQEILRVERVGMDDNFFRLGGDSLSAIRFVQKFNERYPAALSLAGFWQSPTLAAVTALADTDSDALAGLLDSLRERGISIGLGAEGKLRVEGERAALDHTLLDRIKQAKEAILDHLLRQRQAGPDLPLEPVPKDRPVPATHAQQTLWFISHMGEKFRSAGNSGVALRLDGELAPALLRAAIQELVREHDALRAAFHVRDRTQLLMTFHTEATLPWNESDLSALEPAAREARLAELVRAEIALAYHYGSAPLLRAHLVRLGTQSHVIVLACHHLVADGTSRQIMVEEMLENYARLVRGAPLTPGRRTLRFSDFAFWKQHWHAEGLLDAQLAYWQRRFEAAGTLAPFPVDRPAVQGAPGVLVAQPLGLSLQDLAQVKRFAGQHNCSVYCVFMTAFHLMLYLYSGRERQVVSANLACRQHAALERSVGNYADTYLIISTIEAGHSLAELLEQVRTRIVEANEHSLVSSGEINRRFKIDGHQHSLMTFHYAEQSGAPAADAGLRISELSAGTGPAGTMSQLELSITHGPRQVSAALAYNERQFEAESGRAMARLFGEALGRLLDQPASTAASLLEAGPRRETAPA